VQRKNFVLKHKDGQEEPDEATVRDTMTAALQAVSDLHRQQPERDLSALHPAIEEIAHHGKNMALQAEAERTLKALAKQ
jgi:hypothetical protein